MPDVSPVSQATMKRNLGSPDASESDLKPEYDASWAVVVGIDNYQHVPKLSFAVGDATGMASLLIGHLGFQRDKVLVLLDPPPAGDLPFDLVGGEASKTAIEELLYTRLPDLVGRDDRVVIFFAGHGESRELPTGKKKGYLVPATGEPGKWHTLMATDDITETGDQLAAKHVFYLLDACFSGLAIARSGITPSRYQIDMLTNRARQVLTAGTARQAVADAGPGGHSLFTGYVLNGLRGEAKQPGSAAITASDLMVYVKNQVGLAFESQQTPDFGTLAGHGSGGDFLFVLPPADDLYAQAVSALGQADLARFRALTDKAVKNRPQSGETLYLQYRLHLLDDDLDAAIACIRSLQQVDRSRIKIPLSDNDLEELAAVLPFWQPALAVPEGASPLAITLMAGPDAKSLQPTAAGTLEVSAGRSDPLYGVPGPGIGQWHVVNEGSIPMHVYYAQFTPGGRLEVGPLLASEDVLFSGLKPGQEERSYRFPLAGRPELVETRIFAVPDHVRQMVSPPSFNSRAIMSFDESERKKLTLFQRTTVWFRTVMPGQPPGSG
jgi:uncharacterized caspase-like protein